MQVEVQVKRARCHSLLSDVRVGIQGCEYSKSHQAIERSFFERLPSPWYPEDAKYLQQVARRAKERWEKRDTEKWCAHCGAPKPKFKCGGCGEVWFCDREHQKNVWHFHKGHCNKEPVDISVEEMEALMESRQSPEDRAKPSKKWTAAATQIRS